MLLTAGKLAHAEVLIFTDGGDNSSRHHTLDSVVSLLQKDMRGKRHCTFIQAGPMPHGLSNLATRLDGKIFKFINVEDSASGIKMVCGHLSWLIH